MPFHGIKEINLVSDGRYLNGPGQLPISFSDVLTLARSTVQCLNTEVGTSIRRIAVIICRPYLKYWDVNRPFTHGLHQVQLTVSTASCHHPTFYPNQIFNHPVFQTNGVTARASQRQRSQGYTSWSRSLYSYKEHQLPLFRYQGFRQIPQPLWKSDPSQNHFL